LRKIIFTIVFFAFFYVVFAQDLTNTPFGKGLINIKSKDNSWSTKLSIRFQPRYDGYYNQSDGAYSDRVYIRRARIKGSGHVYSPKIQYKFEYDVANGQVLDAVIKWNFVGNWSVWFGQTKLPGNIERLFSSQKLQLVDRSLLNSKFTLDRDAGFQVRHHFLIGNSFLIREVFAISQGEGLNQTVLSNGYAYTGSIELLPFGEFTSKGDYYASDQKREKTPKLLLSFVYDFNQNAMRSRGQGGDYISNTDDLRNIKTIFLNAHFKYQGFSFFSEYSNRRTNGDPNVHPLFDGEGVAISGVYTYYTGYAFNMQTGYLFKNNWEVAGRYTQVTPKTVTGFNNMTQYTIGLSKYVVGHNLKIQGDVGFTQEATKDDIFLIRLQTEIAF
jgi:hypothetical protein